MGKNFSCNNVGDKRRESDFYETPYSLTRLFLRTGELDPALTTVEPACGGGAIVRILEEFSFQDVSAFDLATGQDFLTYGGSHEQLITNPPYSLAFEFIQHAKRVTTKKIAMLLPLSYLHGKRRFDEIWQDQSFPLRKVYIFTRYPHLGGVLREDGKHETGMMVYAVFVWEKSIDGGSVLAPYRPVIHWLDNDAYVVRKGE